MANSDGPIEKIAISYDSDETEKWTNASPNRRVIRYLGSMIKGAANRVLKDGLFHLKDGEKAKLESGVLRKQDADNSTRLNLRTTTKADDGEFRHDVLHEVQRVIDEGPQNPEYLNADENERRQPYNMGVDGAIIRALKLFPPHIKNPDKIKLPDDFFRKGDSDVFKARVLGRLADALEEAKKDHPTRLEIAAFAINEQIQTHPTINKLREELGPHVFDLTELFQWTVQMCKGEVPTRVTEEYMFYIFEQSLELANSIYEDITDQKRAAEIEDGFKEALSEEDCEELGGLEGVEFVKALYKKMGIHLGFQGLQSNRELVPIAKEYDDLARVFRYLMGWDKHRGAPDPKTTRSLWDRKRDRRTKDYIEPALIVAFDKEFFTGMARDEQLERLEKLQQKLGKEYLDSLGVIKVMELAARTATLDGKGHEGRELAKSLCDKNIRIVLGNNPVNAEYYNIRYDVSKGFDKREIAFGIDNVHTNKPDEGLALGRVVPLNTRSEQPLGMKCTG